MARSRNIKPGLMKNEILGSSDPMLTLLFIGLWMLADREGRLEDRPLRIKAEVFPYREGVAMDALLNWLHDNDFLTRYQVDGRKYIQIKNFLRHQSPHKNEVESEIPPFSSKGCTTSSNGRSPSAILGTTQADSLFSDSLIPSSLIPDSGLMIADRPPSGVVVCEKPMDAPETPSAKPNASPAPPKPRRKLSGYSADFERWYALYRIHEGKQAASAAFGRAMQRIMHARSWSKEVALDWLCEAAAEFSSSAKGRGDFVPHPSTWLNEARYDDDRERWKRSDSKSSGDPRGNLALREQMIEERRQQRAAKTVVEVPDYE